ncbi:MAG: hypothetical protein FJ271_21755 [Planctomycetes bacterium]|nr:hypothetical protein [Planctomycetota bacterium]
MEADSPNPAATSAERGLPPVAPPSGRFIAQLFLVPGLIVTFAVLFILGLNYLFVEARDADHYLQRLKDANPDIRWRAAHDLAQELKRTESKLRVNSGFALGLAERLSTALDELQQKESIIAQQIKSLPEHQQDAGWLKAKVERDYAGFLASALGDFVVPVGIPLLARMALDTASPDLKGNTDLRRKAVWALGNLGENLKSFAKLPAEQQSEIRSYLREQASGSGDRASWARVALRHLETPAQANADVVDVLARCARDQDRFLRRLTALVLNFWDSPRADAILLDLTRDDGHGTLISSPVID